MKKIIGIIGLLLSVACTNSIKNETSNVIVEKGTEIINETPVLTEKDTSQIEIKNEIKIKKTPKDLLPLLGFWVGYFEQDSESPYDKAIAVDEGFYWNRQNKINISLDKMSDSVVIGHSVVAGNDRPFKGFYTIKEDNRGTIYTFDVTEPGDNKYDGKFTFTILNNKLIGNWKAYKKIDVQKRKYVLQHKTFVYNANQNLERSKSYLDWNNFTERKETYDYGDGEFEEWIKKDFAASTDKIYEINASTTKLTKEDVENLKKGDLLIIRNTIYARHGYSFKNRPLRVFFDAQEWYIPVHTNIKDDFTQLEKNNIKLLMRYEENADEYYDYFGRG